MNVRAAGLVILLPLCGADVPTLHAQDSSLANAIELMRSDVRANKTQIIGRALALPDSQAKVFWPPGPSVMATWCARMPAKVAS